VTTLVADPADRVAYVDASQDWWYVDDLAEHYSRLAERSELYEEHVGARIFVPSQTGDGAKVVQWLRSLAGTEQG
jgi:hypothetical protein